MLCHTSHASNAASHRQRSQYTRLSISLISLLVLQHSAAATNTAASTKDASASTPAGFSFKRVEHFVMVIPLEPLAKPPTPPAAYKNHPMDEWEWLGGPGYLLIAKSDYNMLGVLSEAFYFPGQYRPKCSRGRGEAFYSAQRLWVNMKVSRDVGRQVWGFPKEMGTFVWGAKSITVRDDAGNHLLQATFSEPLPTAPSIWLETVATAGLPTIQWPLQDKSKPHIANMLPVKPLVAVSRKLDATADDSLVATTQHLVFNGTAPGAVLPSPGYEQLQMVGVVKLKINPQLFTGRNNQTVQLAHGDKVGFIKGTPGSLSGPTKYEC